MARALRRTPSGHIQHDHISNSSIGSGTMKSGFVIETGGAGGGGGGGGGGVVCGVPPFTSRLFHTQHQQQGSNISSLTSLSSESVGVGGLLGSSSSGSLLPRASSFWDSLYSLSKLFFNFPRSCFSTVPRSGSMDKPLKSKGTLYRRPLVQLLISFVLGLLLGWAPVNWFGLSAARIDARHELALEVSGFVTNLPRDGSQSGQKLIDMESVEGAVGLVHEGVGRFNWEDETTDSLRDSKVDVSEESLLEIAPGLNYTFDPERKLIIVITPTYNRPFQAHFLTRLAHTLRLVPPPLLWLVVEYPWASYETAAFLRQTGIMYRHLVCHENITNFRDRGIHERNRALKHIEMHQLDGIVYFADDDNIYSVELFEHLRKIKRFGIWPVGMLAENRAKTIIEGPVCDGEKVIGWHTNEKSKRLRRFHIDMSGFGFNSTILWNRTIWRPRTEEPIRQLTTKEGFQETTFIEQLVEDESQMEGLPSGCNKIMVWHLHLDKPGLYYPAGWTLLSPLESNTPLRP